MNIYSMIFFEGTFQKVAASLALAALIISAFPGGLVPAALAESTGVTIDQTKATAAVDEQVNFVVTKANEGNPTKDTYIILSDDGNGGLFFNGTIGGACNSTSADSDNQFALDNKQGVCYSNATPGVYDISVQLLDDKDGEAIGSAESIEITVEPDGDVEGVETTDYVTFCKALGNGDWKAQTINPANAQADYDSSTGIYGSGINEGSIIPPIGDIPGLNWDAEGQAIYNDGDCDGIYDEGGDDSSTVYGCMDSSATNYNPEATESGESICVYEQVEFCSFAGEVIETTPDADVTVDANRRDVAAVENGPASYQNTSGKEGNIWAIGDFFSLGLGGELVYEFTGQVAEGDGTSAADIAIYEITGGTGVTSEKVEVLVSEDGISFTSVGTFIGDAYVDIDSASLDQVRFVKLIDKSPGGSNQDGYDVDAIVILNGNCATPTPVEPEPTVCTFVMESNEQDLVVQKNDTAQALTVVHSNWVQEIDGSDAKWIWGDNPVSAPTNVDETQTFQKSFAWNGSTITSATLEVASDNTHAVTLGSFTDSSLAEDNYSSTQLYDVQSGIVSGSNTLEISVTNLGVENTNPANNPAGLIYKLTIEGETDGDENTCGTVEPITPTPPTPPEDQPLLTVEVCKYVGEVGTSGWNITLSNGDSEDDISAVTGEHGCVDIEFNPEYGPWTVIEEHREGYRQVEVEASPNSETEELFDGDDQGPNEFVLNMFSELAIMVASSPDATENYPEGCRIDNISLEEGDGYDGPIALLFEGEGEGEVPNLSCTFYNQEVENDGDGEVTEEEETPERRSSGSSGTRVGFRSSNSNAAPEGQVLGAADSRMKCEMFITDYMRMGDADNRHQVVNLQAFLMGYMEYDVDLTGEFDAATEAAVRAFQAEYSSDILDPWVEIGLMAEANPTGYAYMLTRWKINNMMCPGSETYPNIIAG